MSDARDLAVVLAGAGEGTRMAGSGPKLLLPLGGVPLLERVAATFLGHPAVAELAAVVPVGLEARAEALLQALDNPGRAAIHVVPGGSTRRESVGRGLAALRGGHPYVAVHDVARALIASHLITRVLQAARESGAAIPGLPVRDTIKEVEGDRVVRTPPRDRLRAVQTPQIFASAILARAHARAAERGADTTDDAALVEALGILVRVVPGDPANLKLTEPADVTLLETHLRAAERP